MDADKFLDSVCNPPVAFADSFSQPAVVGSGRRPFRLFLQEVRTEAGKAGFGPMEIIGLLTMIVEFWAAHGDDVKAFIAKIRQMFNK